MKRVLDVFRADLPRPILLLQVANGVNSLGFGLVLPFEIIYLHQHRGFHIGTAGLIVATVMGTAAVTGAPIGALLDRLSPKPILLAGTVATTIGSSALAFVHTPWQAFLSSFAAGLGAGVGMSAVPTLVAALVTREQRPAVFALNRVSLNFGIGIGATVGGFIAAAGTLRAFQELYVLNAATTLAYGVVVLFFVPDAKLEAAVANAPRAGFAAVLRDRVFTLIFAGNMLLGIVGYALFGNILPPYAKAVTPITSRALGFVFLVNTAFIVIAQMPAAALLRRVRRVHILLILGAIWAAACLAVLPAAEVTSPLGAALILCGASVLFGIGECVHAILIGPIVVDLAPPQLMGRYMSLFGLSFTAGLAVGPAFGSQLLARSPASIWWVGAAIVAVVCVGLSRLGSRIPDPLAEPTTAAEPVPVA